MSGSSSPFPPADEQRLVERAKHEAGAFAELYRIYLPRIHAYAWRRTGNRDTADDITANTFEAALRALPRFRWGPQGFAPWLFRIAANQVIAHYRRESRPRSERGQWAMAVMTETTTTDQFADAGTGDWVGPTRTGLATGGAGAASGFPGPVRPSGTDQLRQALARLTPRYQRAIDLRYLTNLDHEAAAKAMGLAKPAFAVVLSRALKALGRELARLDGSHSGATTSTTTGAERVRRTDGNRTGQGR